ncbi:hypothetical protein hamaS1_01600 [Moorella sp. Hama-1]|nr:hypothetical protein hamaS1_01600 [Moorella sp. Hama-1]
MGEIVLPNYPSEGQLTRVSTRRSARSEQVGELNYTQPGFSRLSGDHHRFCSVYAPGFTIKCTLTFSQDFRQGLFINLQIRLRKEDKPHFLQEIRVPSQEIPHRPQGDAGCPFYGKAVSPGADGREGQGFDALLPGQLQAAAVGTGQEVILALPAAVPDRAYGVDNITGL